MASSTYSSISCYLSKFLQVVTKKIASEIKRVYRLHHRLCSATPLDWLLSRNLKPRKLILRAFSDFPQKLTPLKIIRHTVLESHAMYTPSKLHIHRSATLPGENPDYILHAYCVYLVLVLLSSFWCTSHLKMILEGFGHATIIERNEAENCIIQVYNTIISSLEFCFTCDPHAIS